MPRSRTPRHRSGDRRRPDRRCLQTIVSATSTRSTPAVVSVTHIQGRRRLQRDPGRGDDRRHRAHASRRRCWTLIERRMREIAEGAAPRSARRSKSTTGRGYPPTVNHAEQTEFAAASRPRCRRGQGARALEPSMGAEDFSYMLEKVPGAMLMLGNGGDGGVRAAQPALRLQRRGDAVRDQLFREDRRELPRREAGGIGVVAVGSRTLSPELGVIASAPAVIPEV